MSNIIYIYIYLIKVKTVLSFSLKGSFINSEIVITIYGLFSFN